MNFSFPPGDPGAPVIDDNTQGSSTFGQPVTTPQVGQQLFASVSGSGSALAGCTTASYQWLRDGQPFAGVPHADDDAAVSNLVGGRMGQSGASQATPSA